MAARSSRCSRAPEVSMRPKMPAMRTVSADSSPCSGDSLTTSTGTVRRAHGVVEDLCQRALLRAHPHDRGHDGQRQPRADEDGGHERPDLGAQLECGEAPWRSLPRRAGAPASRRAPPRVARPPGPAGPAGDGGPLRPPGAEQAGVAVVAEDAGRHLDPAERQLVEDLRAQPGRDQAPHALVRCPPGGRCPGAGRCRPPCPGSR